MVRDYDIGNWGISFLFSLRGSVIPKALAWAVPTALLAIAVNLLRGHYMQFDEALIDEVKATQVWAGYNIVLSFMLAFRTQQAYSRWWEGGSLLQQARGEWFNAYSSLIAFSTMDDSRKLEVANFHRLLCTLMSMLYAAALQEISSMNVDTDPFEIAQLTELESESLDFLRDCTDRVEVILLWVQRVVVINLNSGVIDIAPPILSRAFQELSRGVVQVNNVRKISEFLFPFPYAQLIGCMVLAHAFMSPFICGLVLDTWYWAGLTAFLSVFALSSLNYIAIQIENPFGDDENDLPMHAMQRYMNRTLVALLDTKALTPPRQAEDDGRGSCLQATDHKSKSIFQTRTKVRSDRLLFQMEVPRAARRSHKDSHFSGMTASSSVIRHMPHLPNWLENGDHDGHPSHATKSPCEGALAPLEEEDAPPDESKGDSPPDCAEGDAPPDVAEATTALGGMPPLGGVGPPNDEHEYDKVHGSRAPAAPFAAIRRMPSGARRGFIPLERDSLSSPSPACGAGLATSGPGRPGPAAHPPSTERPPCDDVHFPGGSGQQIQPSLQPAAPPMEFSPAMWEPPPPQ